MISLEKGKIFSPLQKMPKNVGYFGKLIVAYVRLWKVAQSATNCPIWSHSLCGPTILGLMGGVSAYRLLFSIKSVLGVLQLNFLFFLKSGR